MLYRIFFFCTLLSVSCTNPFAVRDAEIPGSNSDTFVIPYNENDVLTNLKFSMSQKNVSNYERCFVDFGYLSNYTFKYVHDQRIGLEQFDTWDFNSEKQYLNTLANTDSILNINLSYLDSLSYNLVSPQETDSVWTQFNYEIRLELNRYTVYFRGRTILKLVKDDNSQWSIYYWEDLPNNENYDLTWSQLKLLNY